MELEQKEHIIRQYLRGVEVPEIASDCKLTKETVYVQLREIPNFRAISEKLKYQRRLRKQDYYQSKLPKICKLLDEGYFATQMPDKLGIPYRIVKMLLKGTKYDNTHKTKEDRNKAIYKEYKKGARQVELAKKYGVSQPQISDILKKANGKL